MPQPRTLSYPVLLRHLLANWKRVAVVGFGAGLIGVILAFMMPEEFIAETRIMPEFQAKSAANFKRFSALAELAGVDLAGVGATEAVRPDLYPDVLTSNPFIVQLLRTPVVDRQKVAYPSLLALLTKPALTWLPITAEASNYQTMLTADLQQPLRLTRDEEDLVKNAKKRIMAEIDRQSGVLVLRVKMPDPLVAAQVAQFATNRLKDYVISYRTDKVRQDLQFLAERQTESKRRYDRALLDLSQHRDQNRYTVTQTALIADKQLEAELSTARDVYSNLTMHYEQARINVQEETPVMKVLEPPTIPTRRSEPKRTLIVLAFGLFGLMLGALAVTAPVIDRTQLLNLTAAPTAPLSAPIT